MDARFCRCAAVILVALAATACSSIADPSKNQTETFTNIIQPGGASAVNLFSASKSGEITVTITNMNPPYNGYLTVAWLQASGNVCTALLQQNSFALVGKTAISSTIAKGSYCVAVVDPGFVVPESYTITVSHP